MSTRLAGLGLAASFLAAVALLPAAGSAAPGVVAKPAQVSDLQTVDYYAKRRWRRDHYVRAPFTEVDTRRDTWVAAPFARVYSGRAGTWVRAPFVNLWVPR
ncbi:MAG: hypothetical protein JJE37_09170 [Methyloceanibacter sp.]|jgi:hypothetical protein|nr:hypothetical protein [Methyloceanibacter sp.]